MRSRRIILATVLVSSLLTAACLKDVVRELAKDISEVKSLHEELTKKFGDAVFVNINQGGDQMVLNVTFINSALNSKGPEDRFNRAQETANIVRTRYPRVQSLNAIWVVFVRDKTTLFVLHERQAVDYYGFDKEANRLTPPQPTGNNFGVELRTATSYLDKTNETDISVSGIQLYGTPGEKGLTVLPHFTVAGDVRAAKSPPPKEVSFDFASYSDREQFGEDVRVEFIADDTYVLRTKGTFNVSRLSGSVSEFCYLKVPYAAFHKMIAAKQLLIGINDRAYLLTPAQFSALRRMDDYVNN
jgi:hypothetical protein